MCIGEKFSSVKQFLNRVSQLVDRQADAVTNWNTLDLYPWFSTALSQNIVTGVLLGEQFQADPYSWFSPMYLYFRGRPNVISCNSSSVSIYSGMTPGFFLRAGLPSFLYRALTAATANPLGLAKTLTDSANIGRQAFQTPVVSVGTSANYSIQQVPYQSKFPISFTNIWYGLTHTYFTSDATVPLTNAHFATNSALPTANGWVGRSFGDDFQFCFFINCPPVFISIA